MSTAFDDYRPEASTLRDPAPLLRARAAVHARARAEAEVAGRGGRDAGHRVLVGGHRDGAGHDR